jgi:hypothetical protein
VADKSTPLVLAGLGRAATGAGMPLHGGKSAPGLFPSTAAGKLAAQRCREEGFLAEVPVELAAADPRANGTATLTRKKTAGPLFGITEKGIGYLLSQVSPRQAIEDFLRALQERQAELGELCGLARQALAGTETLRTSVEKALAQLPAASATSNGHLKALFTTFLTEPARPAAAPATGRDKDLEAYLLQELGRWQHADATEDCPLPHLYRHAASGQAGLTIGRFHDLLRRLHDESRIYLHPWTGPLYQLPEPPYALLVGHEIAYYASLRG